MVISFERDGKVLPKKKHVLKIEACKHLKINLLIIPSTTFNKNTQHETFDVLSVVKETHHLILHITKFCCSSLAPEEI